MFVKKSISYISINVRCSSFSVGVGPISGTANKILPHFVPFCGIDPGLR